MLKKLFYTILIFCIGNLFPANLTVYNACNSEIKVTAHFDQTTNLEKVIHGTANIGLPVVGITALYAMSGPLRLL